MRNYLIWIVAALTCSLGLKGQDMHFSQFTETPALVNPALTGVDGLRASMNYRTQWKSVTVPYNTYGASFEMRSPGLGKKRIGAFGNKNADKKAGRFAAGISVYKDKMGDGNLNLTQANLTLAYFIPTGEKSHLSMGFQGSYDQLRLDNSKFVFPDQYNGTGYTSLISSGENLGAQGFSYIDMGAGVLWSYGAEEKRIEDQKKIKARFGFAVYHLLQPKQKFLANGASVLPMKYVANGDFLISIQNTNIAIAPSYLLQLQGASMEIIAGALIKYYLKNDTKYTGYVKRTSLGLGGYYRNQDAAVAYMLLEFQGQYAFGFTYDVNISALSKASASRGGLELTLRYNAASPFLYQKMK